MAKLNFTTAPTFTLKVAIPVPGKKAVDVEFTFKGRNREEFREYLDASTNKEDVDALMDTVTGWELENEFCREEVERMTLFYPAAARAIIQRYITEISGVRLGN